MGVLFRLSFFLSRLVSATSSNIAVRCSRLERYCWQLLSPRAVLLLAALASSDIAVSCSSDIAVSCSSDIAGRCSRLERSCWQLLSPRAILLAAALASSDERSCSQLLSPPAKVHGTSCFRLLRKFMACSCFSLLQNSGEPISSRAKISKCKIYSLASRGR